ncbi:MAG: TolC family protein, partial [Planctomycetes bacterium]|nr:TolC family protein [Planctomycetota bacterium]
PLFDRNQQGIAEAEAGREEARTRFETAANRALSELDRALAQLSLAVDRRRILQDQILPQSKRSIALGRESLAAGSGDALRLLDAERSFRQIMINVLEARLLEREAWITLEQAVGMPLVVFPTEQPEIQVPASLGEGARS